MTKHQNILAWLCSLRLDSLFLNLCLFSFGSFVFLLDSGYSFGPFLITLFLLGALFFGGEVSRNRDDLIFSSVLIGFFLVGVMDTVLRDQSISNLDLFLRYLIGAFLVLYLSKRKIDESFLWLGYAIGAIGAGAWAVYAKFSLGMVRIRTEEIDPVNFGNLSLLMAFISLSGVFWALNKDNRKLVYFMLFAFFLGVAASFLSGTRSGWIALPLALYAFYKLYEGILPKKYTQIIVGVFVLLVALLIVVPQTGVQKRVGEAVSNIENYMEGRSSTSVGLRFEMWRSAYDAVIQKPVFGWGEEAFYTFQAEVVKDKGLNPRILEFKHLHNQYIEELAKRGIIGLAALLLLFFIPFKLFFNKAKAGNPNVKPLAVAGIVSIICMADFCLTQGMLRVTSAVMVFVFSLVFLWCCLRRAELNAAQS